MCFFGGNNGPAAETITPQAREKKSPNMKIEKGRDEKDRRRAAIANGNRDGTILSSDDQGYQFSNTLLA